MAHGGAVCRQLRVAYERGDEEEEEMREDEQPHGLRRAREIDEGEHERDARQDASQRARTEELPAREGEDEREQVEREWDDPEQRERGDVGRKIGGDAEHQTRRHERERKQAETPPPSKRLDLGLVRSGRFGRLTRR